MDTSTAFTATSSEDIYNLESSGESFSNASNASSSSGSTWPPTEITIIITVVVGLIMVTGLVGNIVVLLVITLDKSMHTTVNRCLFVLALADILILSFLPVLPLKEDLHGAYYLDLGKYMCHFLCSIDRVAVGISTLIFLFVSIDRYFAVCHPLRMRHFSSGKNIYIALVTLVILAVGGAGPYIYVPRYVTLRSRNSTSYYCECRHNDEPVWMHQYDVAFLITVLFCPIPVLLFLYGRMIHRIRKNVPGVKSLYESSKYRQRRSQVVLVLTVNVTVFAVCQTPAVIVVLLNSISEVILSTEGWFSLAWVIRILLYANSASNPIIYFSMSSIFRKAFVRAFRCCGLSRGDGATTLCRTMEMSTIS